MSTKRKKYKLRNLEITRVDQVDLGANQHADIVFAKASDGVDPRMKELENKLKQRQTAGAQGGAPKPAARPAKKPPPPPAKPAPAPAPAGAGPRPASVRPRPGGLAAPAPGAAGPQPGGPPPGAKPGGPPPGAAPRLFLRLARATRSLAGSMVSRSMTPIVSKGGDCMVRINPARSRLLFEGPTVS